VTDQVGLRDFTKAAPRDPENCQSMKDR